MLIAVASHKDTDVGEHAGRARRFWLYTVEESVVARKELRLEDGDSFHDHDHGVPAPLVGIRALICASAGPGLVDKLKEAGVEVALTEEPDADFAVALWLSGELPLVDPSSLTHGHFGQHDHGGTCQH